MEKENSVFVKGHQLYYNFIRPHESLNGYTSAEFSQIKLGLGKNKCMILLDKLTEYKIIKKLKVSFGTRSGHEYTITEFGQELIKFFHNYEYSRTSGGE